jgi:hypothetical protein
MGGATAGPAFYGLVVADAGPAEYTALCENKAGRRVVGPGVSWPDPYRRFVMRLAAVLLLGLGLIAALLEGANAQEKKETTLKGTITCAKCDLKVEGQTTCATVISVKKGDKATVYYFDKASHKKYHGDVCREAKPGSVTGTVSKQGDKNIITVNKLNYD